MVVDHVTDRFMDCIHDPGINNELINGLFETGCFENGYYIFR